MSKRDSQQVGTSKHTATVILWGYASACQLRVIYQVFDVKNDERSYLQRVGVPTSNMWLRGGWDSSQREGRCGGRHQKSWTPRLFAKVSDSDPLTKLGLSSESRVRACPGLLVSTSVLATVLPYLHHLSASVSCDRGKPWSLLHCIR